MASSAHSRAFPSLIKPRSTKNYQPIKKASGSNNKNKIETTVNQRKISRKEALKRTLTTF
jgi:hypothetical protein